MCACVGNGGCGCGCGSGCGSGIRAKQWKRQTISNHAKICFHFCGTHTHTHPHSSEEVLWLSARPFGIDWSVFVMQPRSVVAPANTPSVITHTPFGSIIALVWNRSKLPQTIGLGTRIGRVLKLFHTDTYTHTYIYAYCYCYLVWAASVCLLFWLIEPKWLSWLRSYYTDK